MISRRCLLEASADFALRNAHASCSWLDQISAKTLFTRDQQMLDFLAEVENIRVSYHEAGWFELGKGRQRNVWRSPCGGFVAKISLNPSGVQANFYEWISAKDGTGIVEDTGFHIPEVYSHQRHPFGTSVLLVEYVERIPQSFWLEASATYKSNIAYTKALSKNSWTKDVDRDWEGAQIGLTDDNRIVAFDWARF